MFYFNRITRRCLYSTFIKSDRCFRNISFYRNIREFFRPTIRLFSDITPPLDSIPLASEDGIILPSDVDQFSDDFIHITHHKALNEWASKGDVRSCYNFINSQHIDGIALSTVDYNYLLRACISSERSTAVSGRIIDEMLERNIEFNQWTFGLLAEWHAKEGNVEECKELIRLASDAKVEFILPLYNSLIRAISNRSHKKRVIYADLGNLLKDMRFADIIPNVYTYSLLISIYKRFKDLKKIQEVMEEMRGRGISVTEGHYGSLLRTIVTLKEEEKKRMEITPPTIQEVFDLMREEGIEPGIKHYIAIVDGYSDLGNIEGALALIESLKALDIEIENPLYSALIKVYCKRNQLKEARDVLSQIEVPEHRSFHTLMKFYSATGNVIALKDICEEMMDKGLRPVGITLSILLKGNLIANPDQGGDLADDIREQILEYQIEPDFNLYGTLLDSYATVGDVDSCRNLLEEVAASPSCFVNAIMYNTLIKAYMRKNDVEGAYKVLKEMREEAVVPTLATFTQLLRGLSDVGDVNSAKSALSLMKEEGIKGNTYLLNTLLRLYLKKNESEELQEIVREMDKEDDIVAEDMLGTSDSPIASSNLDENGVIIDSTGIKNPFLLQQQDPGLMLEGQSKRMILQADKLFNLLKKCGDVSELAFAVNSVIQDLSNWKVSLNIVTYNLFIEACVNANRLDNAVLIFQSMDNDSNIVPDFQTYLFLCNGFKKAGDVNGCLGVLDMMKERGVTVTEEMFQSILESIGVVQDKILEFEESQRTVGYVKKEQREAELEIDPLIKEYYYSPNTYWFFRKKHKKRSEKYGSDEDTISSHFGEVVQYLIIDMKGSRIQLTPPIYHLLFKLLSYEGEHETACDLFEGFMDGWGDEITLGEVIKFYAPLTRSLIYSNLYFPEGERKHSHISFNKDILSLLKKKTSADDPSMEVFRDDLLAEVDRMRYLKLTNHDQLSTLRLYNYWFRNVRKEIRKLKTKSNSNR